MSSTTTTLVEFRQAVLPNHPYPGFLATVHMRIELPKHNFTKGLVFLTAVWCTSAHNSENFPLVTCSHIEVTLSFPGETSNTLVLCWELLSIPTPVQHLLPCAT